MKLREKSTVIDMALMQAEAQLEAADYLAAALEHNMIVLTATAEKALKAYLRLRESAQAQPVKLVSRCPECKYEKAVGDHEVGCYEGSRVEGVRWRDMPEPAIPQELATCRYVGIFQSGSMFCGAPMPCAAHPRGEKA